MIEAYILFQTEVGTSGAVARAIGKLDGITTSRAVTGPYDVVALAQVEDLGQLAKLVDHDIQTVDSVTRSLTCVVHD